MVKRCALKVFIVMMSIISIQVILLTPAYTVQYENIAEFENTTQYENIAQYKYIEQYENIP
jgi:hypothetical protein